jgi:type II secretory pathway component PulF
MANLFESLSKWWARKDMRKNRSDFYYDLAGSLEDRVPLFSTLRKYEARARTRNHGEALIYADMIDALSSGSLTDALEGLAPKNELIMIDALQSAGDANMAEGLKFLSVTVEKTDAMAAAARKAIMYPLVLIVIFSGMLVGFSTQIVPTLVGLLPPERWPVLGRILYTISQLVVHQGLYIAVGFFASMGLFFFILPRWRGAVRRRFDRIMPFSLYRDFSGAMLIVSLASLLRTGVSLRASLERAMRYSTPWMRAHLRLIMRNLGKNKTTHFGEAFKTGVLNQYLEDRVQDASERRDPVEAFVKIGIGSIDRVIVMLEKSASRMSSAIMLVCGIMLFIMMGGFFSTALELQNGIRNSAQQSAR